ncbi:hypothetical protein MNBD_GAMMA23-416 [hydrothermal vent metagenome]|uniref:DUF302 domain-containing protein n=1 Tax=hydrothermal vent metagenome TaxID=652676 RepID=A0A3B0ZGA9_9ZZZZ
MNKQTIVKIIGIALTFIGIQSTVIADELMMARSTEDFPETMLMLQNFIKEQGYTPSRVQRVDIGLTKSGYKTDKYRVVFFGKADEIKTISQKLPELIPYLPLKISIFAEAGQTILVTIDPMSFDQMYPNSSLTPVFKRWADDIHTIFDRIQNLK